MFKTDPYDRIYRRIQEPSTKHGVYEEYQYSSTILRRHRAFYVRKMFPKSYVKSSEIDVKKEGTRSGTGKYQSTFSAPVRVVPISEWESIYLNTESMRKLIWPDKEDDSPVLLDSIEDCPIIRYRPLHLLPFTLPPHGDESTNIPLENGVTFASNAFSRSRFLIFLKVSDLEI